MNETPEEPKPEGSPDSGMTSQQFSHSPLSARVPERVARGVHATGCLVLDSPTEFVIDFMQGLTRPFQVVARIVVHPAIMGQLAAALQDNVGKYAAAFGMPPAPPPPPPNQKRPTIQEIYENFKLPEEQMSGNYANSVVDDLGPCNVRDGRLFKRSHDQYIRNLDHEHRHGHFS